MGSKLFVIYFSDPINILDPSIFSSKKLIMKKKTSGDDKKAYNANSLDLDPDQARQNVE